MSKRKQKNKYVNIYSKEQYEKDEKSFNNSINNNTPVDWTSFRRLMIHDLCMNNVIDTSTIGNYKLEDVQNALLNPKSGYRTLMGASEYLMRISPHYYKLNNTYSNISLFCWWLDLYNVKSNYKQEELIKSYDNLSVKLENMHLKHEFGKIMRVLPYQDVYCGLIMESQTDFFIQQVDFKICKLYRVQDGLFNFAINLSMIQPININAYPDYIKEAFIDFREGRTADCWYTPPAEKQICIKLNYQWAYPVPMMINLIKDIFDLNIYKKLKLQSARTDNYKAIMVKVPIDTSTVDKPLLTPNTLGLFAEINRESLNDDIGLIHTLGSDGEAISFKDSNNSRNNVEDAIDDIYNSSGQTKELHNGSSSGTAVTFSVENDSGFIYDIYRQFERWVNRYIKLNKHNKTNYKFYFYLLDITTLNRDKITNKYKEACTLGVSAKGQYLASIDMTPSRTKGSFIMEQVVFDFQNNFMPLNSTYTQSGNNSSSPGRTPNEEKGLELTESGEKTKNSESNTKR